MSADLPTPALRLTLLGAPQLVDASGARPLPWQRPTALLAYLACQPDWVSRDQLATWLRPESSEDSARAYLRRLLHRSRDLGLAGGLEIEPQRLRWAAGADVRDLASAMQARDWPRVLALYRGPLLDGAGLAGEAAIDEFFADERERCRTRWRAALCAQIDALRAAGDRYDIAPLMQRLADDDALDEDSVQFLLDRAGSEPERTVALAAFETLQRRLAYEMALRPLPATQALAQALRERVFAAAQAEARAAAAVADAGADLAPFIGRDAELHAVRVQLGGATRMVTVLGPGGVGKTRLARRVLQGWTGGTAFVDLSEVEDEAGLLTALLGGLRVPAGLPGPPAQQLADWLAPRALLVLLDNAEGLAADRAALATLAGLVAAAPQLRWLVTSREPLALAAEYCVPLGGLPADRPDDEAAALFRAQAERHGYRAAADDAAAIARIARAVDGMPLALELAAQWVRAMTPAEIAAAIEDDLGFLRSDAADRKPGHRSLRAVFDSSWRRLAPAAQQALAALTVCRGSFDAAAARAVAGADRALLLQLAGRSLIQRVDAGRFRLHTLMAQFSAEHLDGEAQQRARQRHMRHYLRVLAERDDLAIGRHAGAALRALGHDLDNLHGAWLQAIARGEWDLLRQALDPADVLLGQLRRYAEAAEGFGRAANACPPSHPLRARARIAQALAVISSGDLDAGSALLDALDHAPLPPAEQADLANGRAMVASMRGERASALAHCAAALAAARAAGAAALEAQAELNLAVTHWASGDLDAAEAHAVRALALAERLGADLVRARAQRTLSVLRKQKGRLDEAQQLLERSTAFFESVGENYDVAYNLRGLSLLMIDRGDVAAQLDYARRSLAAFEALGLPVPIAQSEFAFGLAQLAAGDGVAAATMLRRCLRRALQLDVPMVALRALVELAAMQAGADRALALQAVRFAIGHPALPATDRPHFQRQLDALAPAAGELAAADAANARETLQTLAARVLAAD